jgi:hypothetical protein
MSGLINLLEKQKKREQYIAFDIPAKEKNAEWLTLRKMDDSAHDFCETVQEFLPNNSKLVRKEVKLVNYKAASPSSKMKIRAQISATNNRSYVLRLHCHELNSNGQMNKIARAEYIYTEKRS